MDADDWSYPDRFKRQLELLSRNPDLAVAGCLVEGFPGQDPSMGISLYLEWLNALVSAEDIAREIFIESPLPHPSTMIRSTWLDRIGGFQDRGWAEDYDLWLRMHLEGAHFAKVPEVLIKWRDHPARLTRVDSRYSVENFLRAKAHYLCEGPLA
jgi:cellulose synthase/poly-beta-1,6-N-acetylglucosamine synthase-like glycosyltransferase